MYDNDVMAVAGVAAAASLGFAVPGDVSVVAWEDSALCRMVHPWLTALSRDTVSFGRTAARELLSLLDDGPAATVQVPLPTAHRAGEHGAGQGLSRAAARVEAVRPGADRCPGDGSHAPGGTGGQGSAARIGSSDSSS